MRAALRSERTPFDDEPGISELEEKVLELLELAGIDTATNDQIASLIRNGLARKDAASEPRPCRDVSGICGSVGECLKCDAEQGIKGNCAMTGCEHAES